MNFRERWKDRMHNFMTAIRGAPFSPRETPARRPPDKPRELPEDCCDLAEQRFQAAEERSERTLRELEIQLAREKFFRGMNLEEGGSDEDA